MKTKRVNAGLVSKEDAARRLLDGEVFYLKGYKIYFEESSISPFRVGTDSLIGLWREYSDWQKEVEVSWYEDIPEGGILCWVWDSENRRETAMVITQYLKEVDYRYRTVSTGWKHAEPVKPEECYTEE